MTIDDAITLFHAPQSRSAGVLTLHEELGATYELKVINMKVGEQRRPDYMAINPLGKVPAIRHRSELVTEQVAIFLYLADLFPDAGLTPAIGDARRGPYLRWMVYYAACYEPGLVDRALKREPGPTAMSPYGDFDLVLGTLIDRLTASPYLTGDTATAADVLWGLALNWGTMFGIVPANPVIADYVARMTRRPAFAKVAQADAKLAAEHAAAVGA